jgi:bacterioferritin-associated ferredoxin
MIVCLCRGVSEREIREAARCGAASIEDVARTCEGAGTECGMCRPDIEAEICRQRTDRAA